MAVISRKSKGHEAIDEDLSACVGDKEVLNCSFKAIRKCSTVVLKR